MPHQPAPSIRYRLLGLITGLVLAIAIAYAATAYHEVKQSALRAATTRLSVVSGRLANLLGASATQLRTQTHAVAIDASVLRYLDPRSSVRSAVDRDSALAKLRALETSQPALTFAELWDASGRRVLSTHPGGPSVTTSEAHELAALVDDRDGAAVGWIQMRRDTLMYAILARATRGTESLGYAVQWRIMSSSERERAALADLIGSDAHLYVGNTRNDLWTDLASRVPKPEITSLDSTDGTAHFQERGATLLAKVRPIPATPWTLVVAFPETQVLADARAMLQRLAVYALVVLLLGCAGAWLLSGRLTAPLEELVDAVTAISLGDFSRRVSATRGDEIGQLGRVFNGMTEHIAATQRKMTEDAHELEQQTVELESTNEELQTAIAEVEIEREAAEALAAEQSALIDAMTDAVVVYDHEGRYLKTPNASHPLLDAPSESLLDKRVHDVMPAETADQVLACVQRAIAEREPQSLEYSLEIGGEPVWLAATAAPMPDDRVVWVARDITHRRRAEEALRLSNATLRAVVESAPLAIIVLDSQGIVRQWNVAAERLFGWSAAEIIGFPYPIVPPEAVAEVARMRDASARGELIAHVETRRLRRDGTLIDVSLSTATLRDGADALGGRLVMLDDITERKRLEAQFRQAQKMEAVGQLAGGVAHDFNNLLTVITSYSGMLLRDVPDDAQNHADLVAIREASERAASLTRQLLAFSRQQVLQPRVLDLNVVTSEMEKLLRRLLREDIQLDTRLAPVAALVHADPGQIEQVIMNLIVNARDALPEGGRILLEVANVELDATYAAMHSEVKPGRYVQLAVSDDGIGMDAEMQTRIFEPFFTTKGVGKGTGLGLSTVYGIVRQTGGHLWCYSEPGHGTTFKIYFPLCETGPEPRAAKRKPASSPRGTETILLVEDEAPVRTVASRILRASGYTVIEAADGREAVQLWETKGDAIDLVITDMVMPHLSGRELAAHVRARRPQIPLLFMSGYTEDAAQQRSFLIAGSMFLDKPFSEETLAGRVRAVLDQA